MPLLAHSPSRNQYAPKSFGSRIIAHDTPQVKVVGFYCTRGMFVTIRFFLAQLSGGEFDG
jgi:hypothetical protein